MAPSEIARKHVIAKHVEPARRRGEKTIKIRVGTILKELGWSNRTPSLFSTLGSRSFQKHAGLQLIEKHGGPPSGGPSTSWTFVYRVLPLDATVKEEKVAPNGAGLMSLAGICADVFRELGGGEAFLKAEREWGPDAWERYEAERASQLPDREK